MKGENEIHESYSSKEIIKELKQNGWYLEAIKGDHYQFKHHKIPGKVTVQHPKKDLSTTVVKSIEKQSGLKF